MGKSLGSVLKIGAFAVLGGLTGGLFTAGAFSMMGASAGVMLGSMLFAQPQAAQVSSVQDLKANKSDPAFLPIVCGGDVDDPHNAGETLEGGVWLPGLIIKTAPEGGITRVKPKNKKKGGTGGKLFGSQQSGGDSHFLSLAVAWCEGSTTHPQKLRELKADDKILFREGATENEDGYVERTFIFDAQGREIGWQSENFRHYYGTGVQGRDDVVETWYQREGLHAPGFQGTSYTVILNHQIDDFGHVPQYFGRLSNGIVQRREQCRFYLLRSNGLDGEETLPPEILELSGDWGQQRGWFMTQQQPPREIAELIASRSKRALVEHSFKIWSVDLANPTIWTLEDWELGAGEGGENGEVVPRFKRGLESDIALASRVDVRYADSRKKDENTVSAILPTAPHENALTFDMPCVDVEEEMQLWAQMTLDAAWVSRTPGEVSTLPRRIRAVPGDVLRVPTKGHAGQYTDLMVKNRVVGAPGAITFGGNTWRASVYTDAPQTVPTLRPADASSWAKPILFVANTVCLHEEMRGRLGVVVAACQTPNFKWEKGVLINVDKRTGLGADDWDETVEFRLPSQATMGETNANWTPPRPSRGYVDDAPLTVEMFSGQLVTATEDSVRRGANRILLENGIILRFTVALQTGLTEQGLGIYELSGIKAGDLGSDVLFSGVVPAGMRFMLIVDENGDSAKGGEGVNDESVEFVWLHTHRVGQAMRLRVNMLEKPKAQELREFVLTGVNLKPLSPSGVRARLDNSGLVIEGRARTRLASDDAWTSARIVLTEPRRSNGYRFWVELQNGGITKRVEKYTLDDGGAFSFAWSAADLTALFGVNPGSLSGTVAMDGEYGAGFSREWEATLEI
jgi:hypothetical protein